VEAIMACKEIIVSGYLGPAQYDKAILQALSDQAAEVKSALNIPQIAAEPHHVGPDMLDPAKDGCITAQVCDVLRTDDNIRRRIPG